LERPIVVKVHVPPSGEEKGRRAQLGQDDQAQQKDRGEHISWPADGTLSEAARAGEKDHRRLRPEALGLSRSGMEIPESAKGGINAALNTCTSAIGITDCNQTNKR